MRNTTHQLFDDKTLRHLHDDLNIIGIVRDHLIPLSLRYYRRYGKPLWWLLREYQTLAFIHREMFARMLPISRTEMHRVT